jgi:anti-sigma B factor antagonist
MGTATAAAVSGEGRPQMAPARTVEHVAETFRQGDVTVVRPLTERLDLENASQFRGVLHDLVKSGERKLVVDLEGVSFIDSSGLGALVSALKQLKTSRERRRAPREVPSRRPAARGDVRLAAPQRPVVALLEIIRLDRVFASHPTVEAAVASYS